MFSPDEDRSPRRAYPAQEATGPCPAKDGKPLPFHGGFGKFGDVTTTKYVILGVCEARSGEVFIMALHPYSVLKVSAQELAAKD